MHGIDYVGFVLSIEVESSIVEEHIIFLIFLDNLVDDAEFVWYVWFDSSL